MNESRRICWKSQKREKGELENQRKSQRMEHKNEQKIGQTMRKVMFAERVETPINLLFDQPIGKELENNIGDSNSLG